MCGYTFDIFFSLFLELLLLYKTGSAVLVINIPLFFFYPLENFWKTLFLSSSSSAEIFTFVFLGSVKVISYSLNIPFVGPLLVFHDYVSFFSSENIYMLLG